MATCAALNAKALGVLVQRDTYFRARHGRLKLREEEGGDAHLIAYDRLDRAGQRQSLYRIIPVVEADRLKAALDSTLGVEIEVAKERALFIWEQVRIHLDRVEGLGHFIEFEAVVVDTETAGAEARIESLRRAFGIEEANLIGGSYSDLARTHLLGDSRSNR